MPTTSKRKTAKPVAKKPAAAPKAKKPAAVKIPTKKKMVISSAAVERKKPAVKKEPKIAKALESVGKTIKKVLELLGLDDLTLLDIIKTIPKGAVITLADDLFHPKHRNAAVKAVMDAIGKRSDCKFVVDVSYPGRLQAYQNAFGLPGNVEIRLPPTV